MTTHDELRKLAEAATPGDWSANVLLAGGHPAFDEDMVGVGIGGKFVAVCGAATSEQSQIDARYVAATNPETILALLDENARLRALVEILRQQKSAWKYIAEDQYGKLRIALYGEEDSDYPVEGALDAYANGLFPILKEEALTDAQQPTEQPQAQAEPVAWIWQYIGEDPMEQNIKPVARAIHEIEPENNPYPDSWKPIAPLYTRPQAPTQQAEPVRGAFLNTDGGVSLCQSGREGRHSTFAGYLYTQPRSAVPEALHALLDDISDYLHDFPGSNEGGDDEACDLAKRLREVMPLLAATAAPPTRDAVPDGYRLLPIEAPQEVIARLWSIQTSIKPTYLWKELLELCPTPPTGGAV